MIKLIIISFTISFFTSFSYAFDPSKFLGKSTTNQVANPNELSVQDKANIENLIKVFSQLNLNQKMKLVEYRQAYKEALDNLLIRFDALPKEVKDALKMEKNIKDSLSLKGQEELENYIKNIATNN